MLGSCSWWGENHTQKPPRSPVPWAYILDEETVANKINRDDRYGEGLNKMRNREFWGLGWRLNFKQGGLRSHI